MPRRGNDDVVTRRFKICNGRAINLRVGDNGGDVVPGLFAPVRGNALEISLEVLYHLANGHEVEGALHVGVGRTEELLRELQHDRLIFLGHPENGHDHAQGIPHRNVLHEIAAPAELCQTVHVLLGERIHRGFHALQPLAGKPGRREHAIFHMVRVIHLDQGSHQVLATRERRNRFRHHGGREGRTGIVNKALLIPFNSHDVRMLGDRIKGLVALGGEAADRIVLAQPGQIGVNAFFIGPGNGIDERVVELRGSGDGDHESLPSL